MKLYTRPANDGLRKAAELVLVIVEEAMHALRSDQGYEVFDKDEIQATKNLQIELDKASEKGKSR